MTSSITPITAASNDGDITTTSDRQRPRHGLSVFRESETKALVHLGMDALGEAHSVGHYLHQLLYGRDESPGDPQELLAETLTCMERAEHYLLILGSVFEEDHSRSGPRAAVPD